MTLSNPPKSERRAKGPRPATFRHMYTSLAARLGRLEQRVAILEGHGCPESGGALRELHDELQNRQAQIGELRSQLESADLRYNGLEAEKLDLELLTGNLQARLDTMAQETQRLKDERDSARKEAAALRGCALPQQERLAHIHTALQSLPQELRPLLARYYALDDLAAFLTQCGQFARLQQCWEACHLKVMEGAAPAGLADFLLLALELYNRAFPDNTGAEILAEAGAEYDFTLQDRVGANGSLVGAVLLPGLRKPNGELAIKCLVRLA